MKKQSLQILISISISLLIVLSANAQPGAFSLTNPANGAYVGATPTFTWQAASGATSYQLWINGSLKKDNILLTSYTILPAEALIQGMFTWYIKSINTGGTTQSSETRSILVDTTPPNVFNLVSPADNSWTTSLQPTLSWSASSDVSSGLATYQLWIDGTLDNSITSTSTAPIRQLLNGTHTWQIKAIDNVGNIRTSMESRTINIDNLPPVFTGVNIAKLSLYIHWADGTFTDENRWAIIDARNNVVLSADPGLYSYTYNKTVSLAPGEYSFVGYAHTGNGWHIGYSPNAGYFQITDALSGGGLYYVEGYGTNVSFTIGVNGNATFRPSDNKYIAANKPSFIWKKATDVGVGFKKYQLFIDDVLVKDNLTDTTFTTNNTLAYGLHNWYVKPFDSLLNSPPVYKMPFNVDNAKPNPFNLIAPSDSGIVNLPTPNLSWQTASDSLEGSGMKKYQIWINGVKDRDSISISQNSVAPSISLAQGAYTWYVKAYDNVDNSRQSSNNSERSFAEFYLFSAYSGNYSEIFGSKLIYGGIKETSTNLTDIGFNFIYEGKTYNTFCATTNGTIHLGTIGEGTDFNSLKYQNGRPIIAPLWDYLATSEDGDVRYSLSGNIGDRILTIQFKKMFWLNSYSSPLMSFQVKLYESTSNIEFIYKREKEGPFDSMSASIGITGIGVDTWNFISLNSTGTNPGISSQIETNNLSTCPITDQVYRFEYKAPSSPSSPVSRIFFVDYEPPTNFTLIEPTNSATISTSRPLFKWHKSTDIGSGIDKYELCISGHTPITTLPTDTSKLLTFDLPNGPYTWFVKAYDKAGAFTSSNTHSLTLNVTLPGLAATPTGANEFCVNSANTDFTSTGAANATSYIWEITPAGAGAISGTGLTGTVDWNNTYTGTAQIKVKGHNNAGDGIFSAPITVSVYPATIAGSVSGSGNICLGASTGSLTLSGYTGNIIKWQKRVNSGSWSDIAYTATTYSETPSTVGTWEYRAGIQSGVCSSLFSTVATIIVGNIPATAGTISGTATLCHGQNSVTYTVPTIENATSYLWTLPSGATGTSTTNSIAVNYGSSASSGNITVKGNNSCGDGGTSTLAITVNPLPASSGTISGTAIVCHGQNSVTYTVPTIENATSYLWTLPSGATGTSTTNSISVNYGTSASSGNITVKGNNSCGDGATSTLAITVNPLPVSAETISGTTTVCQGQNSVTYTVPAIANATSYLWTLPSGATGTSTTNSITVNYGTSASSGNITVKGTNNCGDGGISSLAITVNAIPTTPVISLNGYVLHSDATNGNQWYNQSGLISDALFQDYSVTENGDYYVIVSINGCSSVPSNTIQFTNVGIDLIENNRSIKVYPNPVTNELIIEIKDNTKKTNFELLNSIGQVVFKGNLLERTVVQTSGFATGMYLIKFENGKSFEFKKIVKE